MRIFVTDCSITSTSFCCQDFTVFLNLCTRRLHHVTDRKGALPAAAEPKHSHHCALSCSGRSALHTLHKDVCFCCGHQIIMTYMVYMLAQVMTAVLGS